MATRTATRVDALVDHGVGMTDFVKRPTRTAAEVTGEEYRRRVRPGRAAGGLAPARGGVLRRPVRVADVVNAEAVAGLQPEAIGGRPAYVMPSTSGLNARTPLAELADHLRRASAIDLKGWPLGAHPAGPGCGQSRVLSRPDTRSPSGSSTWELGSRLPRPPGR